MTWNPLKRKFITIRPTPAPPLISPIRDRELDILVQKLMHFEDISKNLIKKVKQYSQEIVTLDESERHLSTHLCECGLVHINDELRNIVQDYHSVTNQVGKNVQSMKGLYATTFTEPLKKFRDEFFRIEASLAKREELVASWRLAYNRVQKLQEKKDRIASHIAKLEIEIRAADAIGKELLEFHHDLIVTCRGMIDKRITTIGPCVHALMMVQMDYYGNMTKMFSHLISKQNLSDSSNSNLRSEKIYKDKINAEMSRIKDLDITKTLHI